MNIKLHIENNSGHVLEEKDEKYLKTQVQKRLEAIVNGEDILPVKLTYGANEGVLVEVFVSRFFLNIPRE